MADTSLWDQWNASGGPKYPHAKVIQYCFRNFPPEVRPRTRVLDLGCDSGVNTRFLAEQGFRCSATDISEVGVANTRRLLQEHGIQADCRTAPIDAVPFEDASFELVICIGVLDSVGPAAAQGGMREILRVLAPGGRALLVFASEADMRVGPATAYDLTGYTHEEVRTLTAGFSEAAIDRYITTYGGGTSQHNDFLVALKK